jgi:hypothetical protein
MGKIKMNEHGTYDVYDDSGEYVMTSNQLVHMYHAETNEEIYSYARKHDITLTNFQLAKIRKLDVC